jgi:hypothetical protein
MNGRAALFTCMVCTAAAVLASCAVTSGAPEKEEIAQLQSTLAALEQRKARLEDINAIKRLQRSLGYYMDEALWDEVANLFSASGSIEMGLDGVYRGKNRVREYLYALGGGKAGLSPGQLNEHMQLMPVISVAPDGLTARGTWRDVILAGQVGRGAFWGEGPYENEYVKENGIWKISKLHWFQTLLVPYEGGWAKHQDVNGARFVSGELTPDAPPTIPYTSWPGAFVPPFHFKGAPRTPAASAVAARPAHGNESAPSLAKRAALLAQEVELLHDQNSIENLQRIYGYYIDKGMWSHAADLFTEDGELEIGGRGVFAGKARVLQYLRAIGAEGPQEGRLFDNMQLQPVVHVAPDGKTAKGRWRLFAQVAQWKQFAEWGTGIYENEYVKEDGLWKIRRLHLFPTMYTPYEDGWGKTARARSRLEPNLDPDRPPTIEHQNYLGVSVPPFHYENPVTGKPPYRNSSSGLAGKRGPASDAASLRTSLSTVEQRIGLLEDAAEIERLQTMYGYYLATLEWDALTDLFADDGTIEIALRGVYVGKASVRRNLNLYGQQGLDHGVLHNHMQYQPVIHVAEDGKTAKLRSRAFSMMGNFRKNGMWMGGVYENEFVKVDGVWKFRKDQVMNTYFAPYELGWKELVPRAPPGITESNPPDRPPSFHFDMYPRPFLPPYHYVNPVTGKAALAPGNPPQH